MRLCQMVVTVERSEGVVQSVRQSQFFFLEQRFLPSELQLSISHTGQLAPSADGWRQKIDSERCFLVSALGKLIPRGGAWFRERTVVSTVTDEMITNPDVCGP